MSTSGGENGGGEGRRGTANVFLFTGDEYVMKLIPGMLHDSGIIKTTKLLITKLLSFILQMGKTLLVCELYLNKDALKIEKLECFCLLEK